MVLEPEIADPLTLRRIRRVPFRDRTSPRFGIAIGVVALLCAGCSERRVETDGAESGPSAIDESVVQQPPGGEAVYARLLGERRRASGEALLVLDEELKVAEEEYPLDFRFSYERAKLVVFGRRDHHEAFRCLRRAAEKAIATGRVDSMLEMLRTDGTSTGRFWRLSRGHSEWKKILVALEHRDRDELWHEHHVAAAAPTAAPAASSPRAALDRLLVVRSRVRGGRGDLRSAPAAGLAVEAETSVSSVSSD